jgi:hypothetical protein
MGIAYTFTRWAPESAFVVATGTGTGGYLKGRLASITNNATAVWNADWSVLGAMDLCGAM